MSIPGHANRSPDEIVGGKRLFDSAWHVRQALSWLDYAKRKSNITALQYAALELRFGIEHLWFDIIVTAGGGQLDIREYSRCKGDSTRMYKILDRLFPDHARLVRFSNISSSLDCDAPSLVEWDVPRLKRLHREASQYLHFMGSPSETTDRPQWFVETLTLLETGADYIWKHLITARTGQLSIASMPPEVRDAWEGFRTGQLSEDAVRTRLQFAQPVLRRRFHG
jgi:hypothetical protein